MADQNAQVAPTGGFDLDGAIKAGYSDDDILKALSAAHGFDADAALKSGYSKSEVINHLAGISGAASQPGSQQQSNSEQVTDKSVGVPTPISGMLRTPGQMAPATPKADLPSDLPGKAADAALTALPYVGATAAGLATGGAGFIPEVLAAAAGGGAGSLIEQAGRAITGIRPPASVGDAADKAARDALTQGATEVGGKAIGSILGATIGKYLNSERLYRSALKPAGMSDAEAGRAVKAGIDNGIPLSESAKPAVKAKIAAINGDIENVINSQPANIPPSDYVNTIQSRLDKLRDKWGNVAGEGQKNISQIDNFERQFLLEHGNPQPLTTMQSAPVVGANGQPLIGPNGQPLTTMQQVTIKPEDMDLSTLRQQASPLPARDAQDIKKATYEAVNTKNAGAYGPEVHPALQVRMQQDTASALRQELSNLYPQIDQMNQDEGSLISLRKAIEGFAKREGNKQITPYFIYPMAAMEAGMGAMGGHTEAGLAGAALTVGGHITRQMLEDPAVKSRLAIALKRAGALPGADLASKALSPQLLMRGAEYAGDETSNHGTVMMRAPDGMLKAIPAEQVPHYLDMGATRVQ